MQLLFMYVIKLMLVKILSIGSIVHAFITCINQFTHSL